MGKLNEKMIDIPNPYPVKMEEIIDLVERSTRLIHTTTDNKTIQLYIYSTGRDRPDYLAEVEITSAGYILHDDDGFYYQGSTFKEFQNDLKEVVFHFEAVVFKRLGENIINKEQLFNNILNESSLKEYFFYAPPHNEEDEEDTIIGYIAAVRDYQTQKTKYVDDEGKVCNSKSQAKVFDTKGKADNYSYEHCPEGWTHFVVALKKSDILNEAETTKYMACCYDPEDYYEETNYIDEDGELSCSSSGAKLFDTEDEAIEYADEIKPIGWMSFAMPFNTTLNESDDTYKSKRLKELTQDEFNRLARRRDEFRTQTAISPAEKNNLYADIKDFEKEFRNLQDTAERLPDSYIDQVCDTASYPFEVAIDEVKDVEDWCSEAEEFLKDDINNWGIVKEANTSKKRLKETFDSTSAAFNLTKLKGYLRFETKWEYDEDYPEDAMLVDKVHDPARFTVNWIGPKGEKHPNTYCVRILRDKGESRNWETRYFLKASDAAEMINLEVITWERNNMSWKFESKAALFDCLLEAIDDFPKNTRAMYRFARRRHNDTGAIRKVSKEPYWVHPEGVAKIVMEHGGSDVEIKAAMAHDTMEDAGVSYDDMVEKFGEEVASIVKEVTNDNDEIAKIGKERYISEELCRLSPEALTVKLADMLYNMKDSPTENNYERMRKNVAFLMMNRHLDGKHLELAREIMEV